MGAGLVSAGQRPMVSQVGRGDLGNGCRCRCRDVSITFVSRAGGLDGHTDGRRHGRAVAGTGYYVGAWMADGRYRAGQGLLMSSGGAGLAGEGLDFEVM